MINDNKKKLIGLLGGSFNPPHEGHRYISLYAIESLGLDEIWWIVTRQNPLKEQNTEKSFFERIKRCKDLVSNFKKIKVVNIESEIESVYAIDVVSKIKSDNKDVDFIWLMGNDNLKYFHKWYKWKDFAQSIPIAIFDRIGYEDELFKTQFYNEFKSKITYNKKDFLQSVLNKENKIFFVKNEKYKVSSTAIRNKNVF